jgi:hypothetical protein
MQAMADGAPAEKSSGPLPGKLKLGGGGGALAAMLGARAAAPIGAAEESASPLISTSANSLQQQSATAGQSGVNAAPYARDTSKPQVPIPIPPPLPVGWPPRAPAEEGVVLASSSSGAPGRRPMSLANLFRGEGAGPSLDGAEQSLRRVSVPSVKLKQLHWDLVMLPSVEGTIWDAGTSDQPDEYAKVLLG